MPISDELEALRQSSPVKTQSTRLSDAASKHNFTTPQQQEELRKAKLEKEKQSKLDAERALRSGGTTDLHDLLGNGLYGRLMNEHRRKVLEAQKQLHNWKGSHLSKDSSGHRLADSEKTEDEYYNEIEEGESADVISGAVEMLPDHVVQALKQKYDTASIMEALTKALKEEESGTLSKVMISSFIKKDSEPSGQEQQEQQQDEDDEEAPVDEVREKIEHLSIEDTEVTDERKEATLAIIAEDIDRIEKTKLFYNKHAVEFIANMEKDSDALTPTTLRDSFLNYLHEEVHPVKKTLMSKLGEASNNHTTTSTIIDLGCGHGRDTLHFASLGHHVLAVDYSYAMLHHAKTIAPNAHYLNMDMRMLRSMLVDQSVDGIWAHASLSHLPKEDLDSLLKVLYVAMKVGGVLYFSVKIGTHDQAGQAGELVEADTRYTPIDNEKDICKLNSYYTSAEIVELLSTTGWEVIKIGEFDQRKKSDYPTHSLLYVFATRRKD